MKIDGIGSQVNPAPIVEKQANPTGGTNFGEKMRDAVSKVSDLESQANEFANKLAAGDAVEIHQAMIAMQKASTALQFTIQVRNKIIEAYHEIMRMQV
jgi:flagellar hook-basal body complex protein FliE